MFESIEIRRAANGFILVVTTEEETKEYVYDTSRKAVRVTDINISRSGREELP